MIILHQKDGRRDMKIIKAIREQEHITIKKKDNDYVFKWDGNEDSKAQLRALNIQAVLTPEDYAQYFASSVQETLQDIQEASKKILPLPSDEREELVIEGDIAYRIPLSQTEVLLEITDTVEGRERLRCIISRLDDKQEDIHQYQHVRLRGFLAFYPAFAQFQLDASHIAALPDDTKLSMKEKEELAKLKDVVIRDHVLVKDAIKDWHKILVFCPDDVTWANFNSIVQGKDSKDADDEMQEDTLHYDRAPVRRAPGEELAARIRECNQKQEYDAICFLQGPVRDKYAYAHFYSAELCQALNDSHIPVLAGIGNAVGRKPFFTKYVDFSAKTAQVLAYKMTYWKMHSVFVAKSHRPSQMTLQEASNGKENEHKGSTTKSFFSKIVDKLFG